MAAAILLMGWPLPLAFLAELNCVVRYYVLSAVRVAISALATRAVMILRFAETPNDL